MVFILLRFLCVICFLLAYDNNRVGTKSPTMVVALLMDKRIFLRNKPYHHYNYMYGTQQRRQNHHHIILNSHRVGIIGGGLAGLSTAYHLLEKNPSTDITIFDQYPTPGIGGASAVAGGLLHPLNPRGKLAWNGLEGLALANKLVNAACEFENDVVLRNKIYRIAMNEDQVTKFQTTANQLPEFATWLDQPSSNSSSSADDNDDDNKEELDAWEKEYFASESNDVLGALKLSGDCKVLHMKSYMKGLWSSCQSIGTGTKEWITLPEQVEKEDIGTSNNNIEWEERLKDFDTVIFAAGSGLFQTSSLLEKEEFPIHLVGGQSIEMTMNDGDDDDDKILWNAIICGKYVSPMIEKNRVLIGSTHEFKEEPMTPNEVEDELKTRSYHFASGVWDNGTIDRITSATRVQSNRGPYGRLPIVGKLKDCRHHPNSWIFTGLSGRGLLYHGLFGDNLVNMILEENTTEGSEILNWWRPKL